MEQVKKLIKEVEEFYDFDGYNYKKVEGEPLPGCNVQIFWKRRDFPDNGYCFSIPYSNMQQDEGNLCVHIPHPDNSDGMDIAPEVFTTLCSLSHNILVKKIVCTGGFNV